MTTTSIDASQGPRPIYDTLREIRNGALGNEFANQLQALIAAVRGTGRGGSLTLKLDVKPASRGDVDTLMVTDTLRVALPEADRSATVFFADRRNNLTRRDPRQPELPALEVVDTRPDHASLAEVKG